jgi:hypothetical protein
MHKYRVCDRHIDVYCFSRLVKMRVATTTKISSVKLRVSTATRVCARHIDVYGFARFVKMRVATTTKISSVKLRHSTATHNHKQDMIRKYNVTVRCVVISVARSYHLVQCNHHTLCYCNVLYHVTSRNGYIFVCTTYIFTCSFITLNLFLVHNVRSSMCKKLL